MAIANGNGVNGTNGVNGSHKPSGQTGLWINGLAHQYPPYLCGPERLEELATRFYDVERPGLKKLLQVNRASDIDQRPCIYDMGGTSTFLHRPEMPSITDLNAIWLKEGVNLSAQACRKALKEWGGQLSEITHLVACTTTCYGNPGVDLLVADKIGLGPEVQRVLLAGVGCAGGVAIMRVAAQLACAAAARGKPARILAFACELCTTNARQELADAEASTDPENISIAAALFSDGAGAFVMSNDAGLLEDSGRGPLFELIDWDNATIPNTLDLMGWDLGPTGYKITLTREVATASAGAVKPMFAKLFPSFRDKAGLPDITPADLDWALHPGGKAILQGVQESMALTDAQLYAPKHVYKTRGNSSSPTVLIVLDTLRKAEGGKGNVVACAFGPGMAIEMAFLRRCHPVDDDSD
ncbi:thiolase-like protein [Xylariaceae sp. FL1272]|nr:thiolase-like protein [Xylariaceae sp. FL1272]